MLTLLAASALVARVMTGLESTYYIAGTPRTTYTLAERIRQYRVQAVSIAVIDDYRISWTYATGLRSTNAPASPGTLFQAASMSKPVAAAAILRLFEERHLDLDADVNTFLRSWKLPPPPNGTNERVTMRRLLSHSAGVNVHGFAGYDRSAMQATLAQVLDGIPPANSPPIRVTEIPGAKTEYSGGGTTIAQQVAVDISGQSFPAFMQQTLIKPLGVAESTFDQPLPKPFWPIAASGYDMIGREVHGGWRVYPTMAAAGLWTTPSDLATFVIAIQNALRGRGKPPIDATVARDLTTEASQGFGLGPEVQPLYFGHNGANAGFQGEFYGLKRGGKGVVVMTNSDNGLPLADEIVHSVAKAYDWPVLQPQPRTAIAFAPHAMREFVGTYLTTLGGDRVAFDVAQGVAAGTGSPALYLRSSIDDFPWRLYASAPLRLFTLSGAKFEFFRGPDGRITSLRWAGATFERQS